MNLSEEETVKLKKKLRLIENVLRYQALSNTDTLVNSIEKQTTVLKGLVSALPENIDDFKSFFDTSINTDTIDDSQTDNRIMVTNYQRWLADAKICISEIVRISRGAEDLVKNPIREQVKALAGTRNYTLKDY